MQEKHPREIDWSKLIEAALTAPGSLGETYSRFYNYSYLNQIYLRMQGVTEPVATMRRWNAIGRTVLRGSRAKEIIRPIFVQEKNDQEEVVERMIGFKAVRCIFTLSETEGDELPPIELPEDSYPPASPFAQSLSSLLLSSLPNRRQRRSTSPNGV